MDRQLPTEHEGSTRPLEAPQETACAIPHVALPTRLPSEEGKVTQSALPGHAGVLGTVATAAPGSRGLQASCRWLTQTRSL